MKCIPGLKEQPRMTDTSHISPEVFNFLSDLRENNNREWFQANKNRYEMHVREPLFRFISDFGERLSDISPYYLADPRRVGSSLFSVMVHPGRFYKALKEFGLGPIDGKKSIIPDDFLINPDYTIHTSYYGKNIGDHLPIDSIRKFLLE